ncbi:MAG: ABC transporter substrate-binding protein [Bauldia sp.]|nr:ABC transporter substrate-binding protein [Bauldia sp.]
MALATALFAAAEAHAEPGVFDDRIVFGQSAALEGPAASLGLALKAGILAAFREANRAGGIHGRTLELISYDDNYEPEKAIVNTRRLIDEDSVFALVGEVGTPTSLAAEPIAEDAGVPFVGPFTGATRLRDPDLGTVVNLRASYDQEAEELVRYLTEDLGFTRIAIFYQDDSFGQAGLEGTVAALARRGLEPVADFTYMRNTTAVKRGVLAIRRADPEAVVIVGAYKPTAAFISIAHDIGVDPVYATLSFVGSKALAEELGPDEPPVVVSQVVPLYDDARIGLVRDYRAALTGESGEPATDLAWAEDSFVGLEGYAVGRLVVEALKELGPEPTREDFLALFSRDGRYDLGNFPLSFGPGDNQGSDAVYLTTTNPDDSFSYVEPAAIQ